MGGKMEGDGGGATDAGDALGRAAAGAVDDMAAGVDVGGGGRDVEEAAASFNFFLRHQFFHGVQIPLAGLGTWLQVLRTGPAPSISRFRKSTGGQMEQDVSGVFTEDGGKG